jgi:uncharacterized SAM-binding protein YcdF (DUF218 family)
LETLTLLVKNAVPGSLLFLVLALSLGVLLSFGPARASRWARSWLTSMLILYAVLSLQGTSDLLEFGLSRGYGSIWQVDQAHGARVIVVLSNGVRAGRTALQELTVVNEQSAHNALEAARLYRLLGDVEFVASGGVTDQLSRTPESRAVAVALEALGVPAARISLESGSRTTYEQAVNVGRWLDARGRPPFILVTTPEHIARAAGVFEHQGLHPIASVSALRYGGSPSWRPTRFALQGSQNSIYEYLAWSLYRVRGWL